MASWLCGTCTGENPEGMRFCGHCGTPRIIAAAAVATPTEDRRLITALFADISGFTELAQRVEAESLVAIVDPLVAGLGSIVARYGGTIEKYAGDALMALFGAPVAREDDAERALTVALEMHRALPRLLAALPREAAGLTLHIGVNSGRGIARVLGSDARLDYGVMGDAVIMAQRLESQAPPGETYVGRTTVELAGDRFAFAFVGRLTVKGKDEPQPAWRLLAARSAGMEADPANGAGGTDSEDGAAGHVLAPTGRSTLALVGREAELGRLTDALRDLGRGAGGCLALVGEPGVGKSTLVDAARAHAAVSDPPLTWLVTRCISYGASVPYGPFSALLRSVIGATLDDPPPVARARLVATMRAAGLAGLVPLFARLLALDPVDGDDLATDLGPEAYRRALHDAFRRWLRPTDGPPRVLVVEDTHWLDDASAALLAELLPDGGRPLLVVLTARAEGGAAPLGGLVAEPDVLRLAPLGRAGADALARAAVGTDADPSLLDLAWDRADGNPLFVVELLRALRDRGGLDISDGVARLRSGWDPTDVPPTIEGLLAARIDRLSGPARELIGVASVLGRWLRRPLLARLAEDAAGVDTGVAEILAAGLFDRAAADDHVAVFHHALIADVAYGRLLGKRRRALHQRAADAIVEVDGDGDDTIVEVARHLAAARAGQRAVEALVRAARHHRALFANEAAIAALIQAEQLALDTSAEDGPVMVPPSPGGTAAEAPGLDATAVRVLASIRLELAAIHELRGEFAAATARFAAVRDATGDVRAWRGLVAVARKQGRYEEALATADAAIRALADGADPRALLLERGIALALGGRADEVVATLQAGIDAPGSPHDPIMGELQLQLARARTIGGDPGAGIDLALRGLGILEVAGDLRGQATGLRILGNAYSSAGRPDEAAATLRRGLALAERLGSSEEIGGCLINLGVLAMDRDQPDEAIACYRRATLEFERIGAGSGRTTAYANLADAHLHRGDLDEADSWAERAITLARTLGHALAAADALDTQAAIAHRRSDPVRAATLLLEAADAYEEAGATARAEESRAGAAELRSTDQL